MLTLCMGKSINVFQFVFVKIYKLLKYLLKNFCLCCFYFSIPSPSGQLSQSWCICSVHMGLELRGTPRWRGAVVLPQEIVKTRQLSEHRIYSYIYIGKLLWELEKSADGRAFFGLRNAMPCMGPKKSISVLKIATSCAHLFVRSCSPTVGHLLSLCTLP
jgi:hypothetical protein